MIGIVGDLLTDVVVSMQSEARYGTDASAVVEHRRGGSAANVAVAVTELGAEAAFIGNVGDDERGDNLLAELSSSGVRTFVTRGGKTGTVVALLDSMGERTMLTDRGSAKDFQNWEELKEGLATLRLLYIPGYSLVVHPLADTVLEMVHTLKSAQALKPGSPTGHTKAEESTASKSPLIISVGVSSVGAVEDYGLDEFWEQVVAVCPDLVICNKDESELLGDRIGTYDTVVTANSEPTEVFFADQTHTLLKITPPNIDEVTDTIGAGDAFSAGLLVGLSSGNSLESAVKLGHKSALDKLIRNKGENPTQRNV